MEETLKWTDIELALLDRGFAAIYAFDLFTKLGKRFVIPMIRNERIDTLEKEAFRARRAIPGTPYSWHAVENYEIIRHHAAHSGGAAAKRPSSTRTAMSDNRPSRRAHPIPELLGKAATSKRIRTIRLCGRVDAAG